jgi:CBS domain containing-hemolysin-like protein
MEPRDAPIGELLVIVLLTLLEGFFVAGEIALVSIRRSRVEQLVDEGRPGARRSGACSTSRAGSSRSRSSA